MEEQRTQLTTLGVEIARHDERIDSLIKDVESIQDQLRQLHRKSATDETNIKNLTDELNRLRDEFQSSKNRALTVISIVVAGLALVASIILPLLMKAIG